MVNEGNFFIKEQKNGHLSVSIFLFNRNNVVIHALTAGDGGDLRIGADGGEELLSLDAVRLADALAGVDVDELRALLGSVSRCSESDRPQCKHLVHFGL